MVVNLIQITLRLLNIWGADEIEVNLIHITLRLLNIWGDDEIERTRGKEKHSCYISLSIFWCQTLEWGRVVTGEREEKLRVFREFESHIRE